MVNVSDGGKGCQNMNGSAFSVYHNLLQGEMHCFTFVRTIISLYCLYAVVLSTQVYFQVPHEHTTPTYIPLIARSMVFCFP